MKPATIIIVGAGARGTGYAKYAKEHPDLLQIVGVAEPVESRRKFMADTYNISAEHSFTNWSDMAAVDKFADAVIISTLDHMHVDPAIAFAAKGYDILLEKPMAPTAAGCRKITDAVLKHNVKLAVCHVLRYTAYTTKMKELIDSGLIGEVVTLQQLEPVGYWHQAHSYVRGNWRNESESSSMLLAKSCHDLDWIRYIMDCHCTRISSFGSLYHFRSAQAPSGSSEYCLDCKLEPNCAYSAKKIYIRDRISKNQVGWPGNLLCSGEVTVESATESLRHGQYGRCVYACDNDVVDNQVVNMEFSGGKTASFTMSAFTKHSARRCTIMGTKGSIVGDGHTITVYDFLTDKETIIDTESTGVGILSGHGGGDWGLMAAFTECLITDDSSKILSGATVSLESHLMVFAAESSRHSGKITSVKL